jgi:hypothetical protein
MLPAGPVSAGRPPGLRDKGTANWRMIHGYEPTQHYLARRRGQQKSDAEIRRCLKRNAAIHLFRLMETTGTVETTGTT